MKVKEGGGKRRGGGGVQQREWNEGVMIINMTPLILHNLAHCSSAPEHLSHEEYKDEVDESVILLPPWCILVVRLGVSWSLQRVESACSYDRTNILHQKCTDRLSTCRGAYSAHLACTGQVLTRKVFTGQVHHHSYTL